MKIICKVKGHIKIIKIIKITIKNKGQAIFIIQKSLKMGKKNVKWPIVSVSRKLWK